MKCIDLNCDLGEGMETDALVLPYMTSANIACGYHAGDPELMRKTVKLCAEYGVAAGAHPGFDDRENFGRTEMMLPAEALTALVRKQVASLAAICREEGVALQHVKPHGAMYNMAGKDLQMAEHICRGILLGAQDEWIPVPFLLAPGAGRLREAADACGIRCAKEVFADRAYEADGSLVPRKKPGAVITDPQEAIARAIRMVKEGTVMTVSGTEMPIDADSVCIHGDNPAAVEFASRIHKAFLASDLSPVPFSSFLR